MAVNGNEGQEPGQEPGVDRVEHQHLGEAMREELPPDLLDNDNGQTKLCAYCGQRKLLSEFKRRSGRRQSGASRRGACRTCRKERRELPTAADEPAPAPVSESPPAAEGGEGDEPALAAPAKKKRRRRRRSKSKAAKAKGSANAQHTAAAPAAKKPPEPRPVPIRELRAIGLVPNRNGCIRMRGKTDNGRRWHQEIDPDLALTLVKERAAVVVNRHMISRLYSNKEFRRLILERDQYTCYFCGQFGNTIDHMLPRAKGGHTTPDNCVCACHVCNQSKADRDLDEFMQ